MKVLVVAGGDLGNLDYIKKNSLDWDFIICADGGARHLEILGLNPNLLVGDFDSISPQLLKKYEELGTSILKYPSQKDWTDTQLAVDIAIDKGAGVVDIIGALGNRWDHSYANVMLLYRLEKRGISARILNSNSTLLMSKDILEIKGRIGQVLSLLPFGGDVFIKSSHGLAYPIEDLNMTMDCPMGVSNVLERENARVKVKSGWVIGVLARD